MILRRETIALRRRLDFAQHATDAIARAQPAVARFEVNVEGAHFDRADDLRVDEAG